MRYIALKMVKSLYIGVHSVYITEVIAKLKQG